MNQAGFRLGASVISYYGHVVTTFKEILSKNLLVRYASVDALWDKLGGICQNHFTLIQ